MRKVSIISIISVIVSSRVSLVLCRVVWIIGEWFIISCMLMLVGSSVCRVFICVVIVLMVLMMLVFGWWFIISSIVGCVLWKLLV